MATWTNIDDSRLEPGKPARSVDALALRDNPIAIAEGAPGAPPVVPNAIQKPTPGKSYLLYSLPKDFFNSGAVSIICRLRAQSSGVVTITITQYVENSSTGSQVAILKNGSNVQSYTTSSITRISQDYNLNVTRGDYVEIQHNRFAGSGYAVAGYIRVASGVDSPFMQELNVL